MTNPPNGGLWDAATDQITAGNRLPAGTSPLIRDSANTTPVTTATGPTNTTLSSGFMLQLVSPTWHEATRFSGQGTNNKGKGVQRSLDWTSDAPESEREGKWRSDHCFYLVFIFCTQSLHTDCWHLCLVLGWPRSNGESYPFSSSILWGSVLYLFIHSESHFLLAVPTARIIFANICITPCGRSAQLRAGLQAVEFACQRSNPVAQTLSYPRLGVANPTDLPFASAK